MIAVVASLANASLADGPVNAELFEEQIAPILSARCVTCHNDDDPKGSLSLQSREGALAESDGGQAIVPGDPNASFLLDYITGPDPEMPKEDEPLDKREVDVIRQWIAAGAPWPESVRLEARDGWWSRQPLAKPVVPNLPPALECQVRTPIDAFVLAKLDEHGLQLSSEADARTLVRRLYFDLLGLPPTPQQIDEFRTLVSRWRREHPDAPTDRLPQPAVESLVDELLASPHYGERWARHWLDVVKYADTCGYDKDKLRPHAWPYRDYVIRSLNEDKPYAQFIEEQLAGDALYADDPDGVLGLGFIAAGPWDFIGHAEVPESKIDGKIARHLDRDDMVSNALNAFCSVNIQCARCHDHKFDPYTQEHYYGLQAVFAAVDRADRPYDVDPEVERRRAELTDQVAELNQALAAIDKNNQETTKEAASTDTERAVINDQLKEVEAALAELPPKKLVYAAATQFASQGQFRATGGKPREVYVLHRGNVLEPGKQALPGALPYPGREGFHFDLPEGHAESDCRAALAKWITDPANPFTWRSIVNRVWQYHFGRGIVDSPNDFGRMGERPTHPELLNWLAVEFRDGGQSLKQLHWLICTSAAYRQSSAHHEEFAAIDSENKFLWRANRRRLAAEEIRDAMLAVSSRIDMTMGGPGYYLFALEKTEHSPHYEYHKFDPDDPASHRRTIYRFVVRSQPDPYMTTLDCADSSQSTPKRVETLNSLQALALLNNRFNLAMAGHFAGRVANDDAPLDAQVRRAILLALGRQPTDDEQYRFAAYAEQFGMANLCRAIFNLSEFVYLD